MTRLIIDCDTTSDADYIVQIIQDYINDERCHTDAIDITEGEVGFIKKREATADHWEPDSYWDDHPAWPVEDWVDEVKEYATRLSYISWVNARLEED